MLLIIRDRDYTIREIVLYEHKYYRSMRISLLGSRDIHEFYFK